MDKQLQSGERLLGGAAVSSPSRVGFGWGQLSIVAGSGILRWNSNASILHGPVKWIGIGRATELSFDLAQATTEAVKRGGVTQLKLVADAQTYFFTPIGLRSQHRVREWLSAIELDRHAAHP
jgi:hypothetical protein